MKNIQSIVLPVPLWVIVLGLVVANFKAWLLCLPTPYEKYGFMASAFVVNL